MDGFVREDTESDGGGIPDGYVVDPLKPRMFECEKVVLVGGLEESEALRVPASKIFAGIDWMRVSRWCILSSRLAVRLKQMAYFVRNSTDVE